MTIRQMLRLGGLVALAALSLHAPIGAQQRDEQFYWPGAFNWKFLSTYPEGARLFNAFDYGHAVLYERLYTTDGAETDRSLEREYRYLTTDLLIRPPRFGIAEEAVMPAYAKLAWRAKQMFDWAHILHRQIYDIYSDERLTRAEQDAQIEQVTDYYLSRKEYAFLDVPKSMELMDDQYFSKSFREAYPNFNGLIWAYHWLQVGLYEPLIAGQTAAERKTGVQATLGRFWSMLEEAPSRMPREMPMTSGIAPLFSAAHPRAAVIFDNLHMMHDIISDILHNDVVPMAKKGEEINAALDEFQNPTTNVMTMEMWRNMADHMGGVDAMGGAATGILKVVQAPAGGHGMMHDAPAAPAAPKPAAPMSHDMGAMGAAQPGNAPGTNLMRDLHHRMMQDTVIHRRMMADTTMRRLMMEMMAGESGEHQAHPAGTPAPRPAAKPAVKAAPKAPPRKPPTPAPTKKPTPPPTGHDGHGTKP
ncbi:MAG: hypothetical protein H0W15_03875 [Gemmatimonadales bacterium]|nr:hypothetical protein [Gemmatimonadales bacterium]